MALEFNMGVWGFVVLIVGALALGIIVQLIGEAHTSLEWIVTALGAGIGGFVASEFIVAWREFAPVFDGLALVPALIGGLVVGLVVAAGTRFFTGERLAEAS